MEWRFQPRKLLDSRECREAASTGELVEPHRSRLVHRNCIYVRRFLEMHLQYRLGAKVEGQGFLLNVLRVGCQERITWTLAR